MTRFCLIGVWLSIGDSLRMSKLGGHRWATGNQGFLYITTYGIMGPPEPNGAPPGTVYLELEPAKQKDGGNDMADSMTANQLTDKEREAILKALVSYYMGAAHIADALNRTEGISKGTYYSRKEQHPDEINRLHAEAKAIAMRQRSGDQIAFEARQVNASMEIQREAWDIVRHSVPVLERIVSGKPYIPEGADKPVRVYPRDIKEAFRILQSIGRAGVMPERYAAQAPIPAGGKEDRKPAMLPLLPVNANFSSVTATTPDGTRFTAKVERDGEVVDGKAEE